MGFSVVGFTNKWIWEAILNQSEILQLLEIGIKWKACEIESNQIKTQKIGNCILLIAYSKIFVCYMTCITSLVNQAPKHA